MAEGLSFDLDSPDLEFSWTEWKIEGVDRLLFSLKHAAVVSRFHPGATVRKRLVTQWKSGHVLLAPWENDPDIPLARTLVSNRRAGDDHD